MKCLGRLGLTAMVLSSLACDSEAQSILKGTAPDWVESVVLETIESATTGTYSSDAIRLTVNPGARARSTCVPYVLSPDESSVLFRTAMLSDGPVTMWLSRKVEQQSDAAAQVLFRSDYGIWYPTWSPDGESIAFIDQHANLLVPPAEDDLEAIEAFSLYLAEVGSGAVQERTSRWYYNGWPTPLAWSPDGTLVAFDATFTRPTRRNPDTTQLYTLNVEKEGSQPRAVTTDPLREGHPAFSPDGRKLAYVRGHSGRGVPWHLVIVNLDDLSEVATVGGELNTEHPDWGDHEVFAPQWLTADRILFRQQWSKRKRNGTPVEIYCYDLKTKKTFLYETVERVHDGEGNTKELRYRHNPETGEETLIKTEEIGR